MSITGENVAPMIGAETSSHSYNTSGFWERLWRSSGIHAVLFLSIAYAICGLLPEMGATTQTLVAFYGTHHARILIATVVSGLATLNLMWFAAALRSALADAGRDGWGAAATASSAALAGLIFLLTMLYATLAYAATAAGSELFISSVHKLAWAGLVLSSFPRAMLIMAGTFGLWRAGLISNKLFSAGLTAVVLVLSGGTAWMDGGFWAPDGAYSRFLSPAISALWVVVASRILLKQAEGTKVTW
jgi:hypothetical protein